MVAENVVHRPAAGAHFFGHRYGCVGIATNPDGLGHGAANLFAFAIAAKVPGKPPSRSSKGGRLGFSFSKNASAKIAKV